MGNFHRQGAKGGKQKLGKQKLEIQAEIWKSKAQLKPRKDPGWQRTLLRPFVFAWFGWFAVEIPGPGIFYFCFLNFCFCFRGSRFIPAVLGDDFFIRKPGIQEPVKTIRGFPASL